MTVIRLCGMANDLANEDVERSGVRGPDADRRRARVMEETMAGTVHPTSPRDRTKTYGESPWIYGDSPY